MKTQTHTLTRAQARAIDTRATEVLGLQGIVQMENAGRGSAQTILELLNQHRLADPRVSILCGGGNNGVRV